MNMLSAVKIHGACCCDLLCLLTCFPSLDHARLMEEEKMREKKV